MARMISRSRAKYLRAKSKSQLTSALPTIHEDTIMNHMNASSGLRCDVDRGHGGFLGWLLRSRSSDNGRMDRQHNQQAYTKNTSQKHTKTRVIYFIMAVLFVGTFVRPYHYFNKSSNTSLAFSSSSSKLDNGYSNDTVSIRNFNNQTASSKSHDTSSLSNAPLFYHISPGSTGSRTLYHAACQAGFPSVHHKSFCISQTQGINGVSDSVVEGVRAHFEILRYYQIADECCSLWSKHKLSSADNSDPSDSNVTQQLPCHTPLHEWASNIEMHLTKVVQSGLVGLFDTPYPYLAPKLIDLSKEHRISPPVIAMTERDPTKWAASRSKNHGLLVCRKEYSYNGLGGSEFDALGCITRAYASLDTEEDDTTKQKQQQQQSDSELSASQSFPILNFWDVFQHRSHNEPIDAEFQKGMERQMEHHQQLYLPLANYTPDFFGMKPKPASQKVQTGHLAGDDTTNLPPPDSSKTLPIEEKDVALDIRKKILFAKKTPSTSSSAPKSLLDHLEKDTTFDMLRELWRDTYTTSLTCRGRVNWEKQNNTLVEQYHLPKTCVISSKAAKSKMKYIKELNMKPLIQV